LHARQKIRHSAHLPLKANVARTMASSDSQTQKVVPTGTRSTLASMPVH